MSTDFRLTSVAVKFHSEHVAELCMQAPPVNSLSVQLCGDIGTALKRLEEGGRCRAVVLTSATKTFTAGLDVAPVLKGDTKGARAMLEAFTQVNIDLLNTPLATVAAVSGANPAGGAVMVLQCDYRLTGDGNYRMGMNEASFGLPMLRYVPHMALRVMTGHQAAQAIERGLFLKPHAAVKAGLVDEVVSQDTLLSSALAHAEQYAAISPLARTYTKKLLRQELLDYVVKNRKDILDEGVRQFFSPEVAKAMMGLLKKKRKTSKL